MVNKYISMVGEFTAKSMEWDGKFDLYIYKGDEEIYCSPVYLYSLKDCSTTIRRKLGLKGKRINWVSDN